MPSNLRDFSQWPSLTTAIDQIDGRLNISNNNGKLEVM